MEAVFITLHINGDPLKYFLSFMGQIVLNEQMTVFKQLGNPCAGNCDKSRHGKSLGPAGWKKLVPGSARTKSSRRVGIAVEALKLGLFWV